MNKTLKIVSYLLHLVTQLPKVSRCCYIGVAVTVVVTALALAVIALAVFLALEVFILPFGGFCKGEYYVSHNYNMLIKQNII